MNKILLCLFLPLLAFSNETVLISGYVKNPLGSSIVFYRANKAKYENIFLDSVSINKDGSFSISIPISKPTKLSFRNGEEYATILVYPNQQLSINVDAQNFDKTIQFFGDGATINNYMITLSNSNIEPIKKMYAVEKEFVKEVNNCKKEALKIWNKFLNQSTSSIEKELMMKEKESIESMYNTRKFAFLRLYEYRRNTTENSLPSLSTNFHSFTEKLNSKYPDLIEYDFYYSDYIRHFYLHKANLEFQKDTSKNYNEIYLRFIREETIPQFKTYLLANNIYNTIQSSKNAIEAKELFEELRTQTDDTIILFDIVRHLEKIEKLKIGSIAPIIEGKDSNGILLSSRDYVGKVIYIDVWASWCGPCVKEIPNSKKLYEILKGQDITFLNVSLDKNLDHWKNGIYKHQPIGVNINDRDGSIKEKYIIGGIPHYIIINKDGTLYDDDAPRPSDENTLNLLKELISK